ncbi:hypothetical protein [Xanthocytophaga agilis]|uniref:Uncharacterized protein n=1 Tax=Xanthocytophaga agilis TaxID=3048010 RepID=A0AAE3RCF9_9BACT|nr:hypothetical protein [Xanthocytophaga agilis]MDJ1505207.1 hypothetical protein [Xanthocytophaga agilis]
MKLNISKVEAWLSYIITLFAIVREKSETQRLVFIREDNHHFLVRLEKDPEDIVNLEVEYDDIRNKILDWMEDRYNLRPVELNEDESRRFILLSDAAYYFVTEREQEASPAEKNFIACHLDIKRVWNTYNR